MFARIRRACADVAARARAVQIDEVRLRALALELLTRPPEDAGDPAHHRRGTEEETLAYVLTLDAINFGSGWFPHLRKRPGCSGYFTVALALAEHFDAWGPWSADALRGMERLALAEVLGQDPGVPEGTRRTGASGPASRRTGRTRFRSL